MEGFMSWAFGKLYFNIEQIPCLDIPSNIRRKTKNAERRFKQKDQKMNVKSIDNDDDDENLASLRPARRFK